MALDFNGTTAKDDYGDVTFLDGLTTWSFHIWVNVDVIGDGKVIMSKRVASPNTGLEIALDNGNAYVLNGINVFYNDSVNGTARASSATNSLSTTVGWQSIGCSLALNSTDYKTYVDGVAGTAGTSLTGWSAFPNIAAALRLGARSDDTAFSDAQMAEPAFWNRVLTADEFTMLSKGFSPLFMPRGLLFYDRLINTSQDLIRATAGTITAATVVAHPRILYPAPRPLTRRITAAASAGRYAWRSRQANTLLGAGRAG